MGYGEALFLAASVGSILFGIAILVGLWLLASAEDVPREDLLHTVLSVAGWVVVVIGILGSMVSMLSPMGFLLWMALLLVVVEVFAKYRVARQHSLLWLLTVAAERLIPLIPAIEAFAHEQGGGFAVRARRLAAMLTAGVPLPDALRRSPGLLPADVLPIVRVGYESGALAPALRRAAAASDSRRQVWLSLAGRLVYLFGLMWFGMGIAFFVMIKIVPSYQKIFEDFDARLPAMTRWLISISNFVAAYWFLFAPLLLVLFLLLVYASLRYVGFIHWTLPGTYWLVQRLDAAIILDSLALAAEYQRPLPEALASLAGTYARWSARRRLQGVVDDLYAGADWCQSLFAQGLIKQPEMAILQAARRAGNLPWALHEMADSSRRRLAYRLQALIHLLFPPVILVAGLVVMFFVVSLFLPLISLIQRLT